MSDSESRIGETLQDFVRRLPEAGDATALVRFEENDDVRLSYRELGTRARAVAAGLQKRGVQPGEPVVLFATNGVGWVICRFALILVDALCVPVDYDSDAERLRNLIEDSGTRRVFASPDLMETVVRALENLDTDIDVVLVERPNNGEEDYQTLDDLADEPADTLPEAKPDAPVALFYTSGTTGPPKAVPLTHVNIRANLSVLLDLGLIGSADRVLLPLPMHHAYPFVVGLLVPLASRATLVLPAGVSGPPLRQALRDGKVTTIVGVPRLYEAFVAAIDTQIRGRGVIISSALQALVAFSYVVRKRLGLRWGRILLAPLHRHIAPTLRLLVSGGARLDPDVGWRLEALGYETLSGYGLVETTSTATFNAPGHARMGSAGRPHRGVEMRIRPVEEIDHGEIQFRGPIVFSGYRNNPDANEGAFVDGWFRTGDLGWQDDNGFLYIAGRLKEMIVLPGGKNVSPEEVEKVYMQSAVLKEVAVLERNDRLVAIVVPDAEAIRASGTASVADAVRVAMAEMGQRLPHHMRLSKHVIRHESLPRNQLGKYLRRRLSDIYDAAERGEPVERRELSEAERERLSTPRARRLIEWLEARFPDQPIHPDMTLGGDLDIDSLAWVDLSLDLSERLGILLSEEAIAAASTVNDLVNAVEQAKETEDDGGRNRAAERLLADRERWFAEPGPAARAAGWVLYGVVRAIARLVFSLSVERKAEIPAEGPVILAPNHVSDLDPGLVAAALPYSTLRRTWWGADVARVFDHPIGRALARIAQIFPVDERAPGATLDMAADVLERGRILTWFPEEWRSPDASLQRFRSGVGALVDRTGATVVPVWVSGTFEAMPRTARVPRRHPVRVIFGEPVAGSALTADLAGEDRQRYRAIAERIRNAVAALAPDPGESSQNRDDPPT